MFTVKRHRRNIIKLSILIFFIISIFLYVYSTIVRSIANIIIVSYLIANILNPIVNLITVHKHKYRKLISVLLILIVVGIFLTIVFTLIPIMFKEINNSGEIIEKVKEYLNDFEQSKSYKDGVIVKYIYDIMKVKLEGYLPKLMISIFNGVMDIGDNLISYAVVPIVIYYFLADRKKINQKVYKFIPLNKRVIIRKIVNECNRLLGSYLLGQMLLCVIISVITFFILLFLKVKFILALSLLNGIMNIIPYFGPIFGAAPIIMVAFLDSTNKGIWVLILLILLQQIEGNILSPKITGESTDIHPLIVIIILLIGEKLGGFTGMILAVPVGVIIKVIYEDVNYYLF